MIFKLTPEQPSKVLLYTVLASSLPLCYNQSTYLGMPRFRQGTRRVECVQRLIEGLLKIDHIIIDNDYAMAA